MNYTIYSNGITLEGDYAAQSLDVEGIDKLLEKDKRGLKHGERPNSGRRGGRGKRGYRLGRLGDYLCGRRSGYQRSSSPR